MRGGREPGNRGYPNYTQLLPGLENLYLFYTLFVQLFSTKIYAGLFKTMTLFLKIYKCLFKTMKLKHAAVFIVDTIPQYLLYALIQTL